jgi:molecular chaperone DnaJ
MTQATRAAEVEYETLDGFETLVLPRGTQTGHTFRLRNRGAPHVRGRGRGDLLVEVVVDTPTDLDAAQDALLRQLAEQRSEPVAGPDAGLFSRIRSAFK